jgi:predicted dehydrogenase
MIRVAVLGAGSHSRREHLPSLRLYQERFPGRIELTALCDPKVDVAAEFGFAQHCVSLDELLARRPDAIIAVTPAPVTAAIAIRILETGIPLLMEKPLGANLGEARAVVRAAEGRPVMVSMNRRFDPAVVAMAEALRGRRIDHLRACMERVGRAREGFLEDAGLHAIDVLRFLAGGFEGVEGTEEVLGFRFTNGARGLLELHPDGGRWEESYDAIGPGFHAQALATRGFRLWERGKPVTDFVIPPDEVPCLRCGTYGETAAFLEAVAQGGPYSPSPAEVFESERSSRAYAAVDEV